MIVTGETVSHYRVLDKLGSGGMGVVYRAHDERLDRDVALKVLPAGLLSDETARSRFRREALTLSRLNHPNIAVVFDFDSANGADFLTMEYVEGETLAAKSAAGPLAEAEIVDLGTQIAEALHEAHEHQIIHRDLKPANVMVNSKGRAKVLDFGLAKHVAPPGGSDTDETVTMTEGLTGAGAVVGTVPYMAPEQLQGKALDARTDIYALGAILYEMATGRRPFSERQSTPLIASILTEPPRPPRELNGRISPGLEAVILKTLEKDPGERYQSASEVLRDLAGPSVPVSVFRGLRRAVNRHRMPTVVAAVGLILAVALLIGLNVAGLRDRLTAGSSAHQIQSIAVLPLANLSGDPQQEYFADGMTDALITSLAKISSLRVISRTSVMGYKGTGKPASEIARELNVDALIEGSVLREGGQVRITAQLVQASTDEHLWAETYQREIRGVLVLQEEITRAIAGGVRAALTPAERSRLASARRVNPEAYDALLMGMQKSNLLTPQAFDIALEYFELALKKDPNYAEAHLAVANTWLFRNQLGYTPPREGGPKAKAAVLKALELDGTLAKGHALLAWVDFLYEWDWADAEVEWKSAIELNSNFVDSVYSHFLWVMKRPEEAMAQMERALQLDPLNEVVQLHHAWMLQSAGRDDEAIVQARKLLRTSPQHPVAHQLLSVLFLRKGMYEESLAEIKASYSSIGDRDVEEALTQGYAQSGYRGAMKRAADLLEARAHKTYVNSIDVACLYALAGENTQALEWLEKSLEERSPQMPYIDAYVELAPLRSDPRFRDLLRKMSLPMDEKE